ncbi:MAG TPA: response regulator transcription factor [Verrucomicrobiota bacterium]|jgi:two-component system response regulator NreC|nr:response regulator transcription factor [Verrucomicrobiota bacterium]HRT09212.1 response regulator transcription factor [Candidatus Paceibacterota bacterium]HRT58786.1 response regulator transcription factor [Candidatus Paceibacterota bacterium]
MKKLEVLLADDHQVVREGLRLLIGTQPDMHVAGEAGTGREVLAQARQLQPDVVVMDLAMPELNGLQATLLLKAERPATRILVLTMHEDEKYLLQVCKAGAAGYVLKRSAGEDLLRAIRTVAQGGFYFDPTLAGKALVNRKKQGGQAFPAGTAELSRREKEVLILLAWGYSNKEVAAELGLSAKTVETYRVRIAEKLGLRSRTDIVHYALRQGWLDESHPLPQLPQG